MLCLCRKGKRMVGLVFAIASNFKHDPVEMSMEGKEVIETDKRTLVNGAPFAWE